MISIVGYIILLTASSVPVKVFATCLVTAGLYPAVVLEVSWLGINTGGFTKRGTTWAMAEVFGQSFSIMGTHVYDGPPRYIKGHSVVLGFLVAAVICTVALMWWMGHENARKESEEREWAGRGEKHPHEGRSLEEEYDFHNGFRYIL